MATLKAKKLNFSNLFSDAAGCSAPVYAPLNVKLGGIYSLFPDGHLCAILAKSYGKGEKLQKQIIQQGKLLAIKMCINYLLQNPKTLIVTTNF